MEMMVVLVIMGVLIGIAVPAFGQWRAHAAVNDAATAIMGYLKQARNMAMAENRSVRIEFSTPTTYIFDKGNKDPTKPPVCAQCKNMTFSLGQYSANLRVNTNIKSNTVTFGSSGTGTNSMITLTDSAGTSYGKYSKKIKVNYIGRAYFAP